MRDWIENVYDFLIKFLTSVLTFLLDVFRERGKSKKKFENLKQIILAELIHFLATFILYGLKCYMYELVRRINGILFASILYGGYEEKLKKSAGFILHDKKSKDETFGWVFALSKKYEESFPKEIVKEIKDIQESIEDFYDKLERFHKGLIDGKFIEHLREKYRSVKPEIEDIYFDMEFSKLIIQTLTDLKDYDHELTKEVIHILSEIARLSNKKPKYSNPDFCIKFVEEIKPLIFKIDKLLEKERTNL